MAASVTAAVTQMSCNEIISDNIEKAQLLVREAASKGAQIVLLQELFQSLYFCQEQHPKYFDWANEEKCDMIHSFCLLAEELRVANKFL
jgi:N-carbamoylputrescine amidase